MTADPQVLKPHGKHLIAGKWIGGGATFANPPTDGRSDSFQIGMLDQVDTACIAAEQAFWTYGYAPRAERAAFLDTIANEIDAREDAITEIGHRESGQPTARLEGERGRADGPNLFATTAAAFLSDHTLSEKVFGPLGLVVRVKSADEMHNLAKGFEGQLTATLHMDDADAPMARTLLPILEHKAGRVLVNGFPTGVEVCDAMVHGGPYPASTNFGATSVGTLSIRRFLRPVCYQNLPASILPDDLAEMGV